MTQLSLNRPDFQGLLAGLVPGPAQTWGQLTMLPLLASAGHAAGNGRFVSPLEHLKLVQVPTYGSLVLQNTSSQGLLIVPMHIGFFQIGAQNHATSRVLILAEDETLTATDCYCIQQTQGGLLKEAQQRFITLPLNLRPQALDLRNQSGFSRLWGPIEQFNRRHGIKRGGHLERFLRPNFARLVLFRHTLEVIPSQVGAAYFVADRLVGIEVAPDTAYWQDIAPILHIYCYGAAALLAEQRQMRASHTEVALEGIESVEDLGKRLLAAREQEQGRLLQDLLACEQERWTETQESEKQDLRVLTLSHDAWRGQTVKSGEGRVYLSLFRALE